MPAPRYVPEGKVATAAAWAGGLVAASAVVGVAMVAVLKAVEAARAARAGEVGGGGEGGSKNACSPSSAPKHAHAVKPGVRHRPPQSVQSVPSGTYGSGASASSHTPLSA